MLSRKKKSPTTRKGNRSLRVEGLEGRRLLASDLGAIPFHNPLIAQDVDYDFNVSPRDALMIINELNGQGSRALDTGPVDPQGKAFIDVDGDGNLSPLDALLVINHLNGEGETNPLITYTADITDTSGTPITQIVVGQTFRLNVFVQDTRQSGPTGVFQNAIDVGVPEFDQINFPTGSANFRDSINFGTDYRNGRRAFRADSGNEADEFFNEVTSFASSTVPPDPTGGVYLFFSADIQATSAGTVNFNLNQHENDPTSQVNVFDQSQTLPNNGKIDPSMISYGSDSIDIIVDPTAPTAVDDTVTTAEDTALQLVGGSVNLTTNDSVTSPRTLSVVSVSSINGTTQGSLNGTTYTPPANFSGSDTLTYIIEDSTGLRDTGTITINVTPVNDAPLAVDDSVSVDEETTDNQLDVLTNDNAGPNEASDSITIVSVTQPANGTVTIAAGGGAVLFTPNLDFIGQTTFDYTVRDSGGLTDTATVTVEVEATVLPRARTDRATVAEDSTDNTIAVLANDRANTGQTVLFVGIASNPANGTVTADDNGTPSDAGDDTVRYTPNANFFGTDTFTYTMNDTGTGNADSVGTVTVTVTPVNDPVALTDDTANATEDTTATIAISSLLSNDSPGAGESASQNLSLDSVAAVGTGGSVAIVGGNVIYTPAADFNGEFTFTYNASDDQTPASSATATVSVTVAAVNDAPIGSSDTASTTEDTALTISATTLLSNDAPGPGNESAQTLSVSAVAAASSAGGTVSLNGTDVVYTPAADFNGSDTFQYTLRDQDGLTATATVTVSVAAINDAPTLGADTLRAFKDNALQVPASDLLGNDTAGPANESSQTLSISAVTPSADTHGSVTLNGDGSVTYTPDAGYTGPASFTYTVTDSGPSGGSNVNSASRTVDVNVEEFVPTDISGTAWMDENNDGVINGYDLNQDGNIDLHERRLGGQKITLTGVSLGKAIQPVTKMTLADGTYSFQDLGPGQYVVSFAAPEFLIDGQDVAGSLGDADSIDNQFTINIAQPGGTHATDYNFAVRGVESQRARVLDQLASRYTGGSGSITGAFFALGQDNSLLWGALLDGFEGSSFSEAVLSADGSQLILSVVDGAQQIRSAILDSTEFVKVHDEAGNTLIRVIGPASELDWQVVSRGASSPIAAQNYLSAIDDIFGQEGWGTSS